jgi:hypothetical protein
LMDGIWWRKLKGLCEYLVGNGWVGLRFPCNLTKKRPYALG